MSSPKIDAGRIMAALAKRHRPPAWALLEQVGNGTGYAVNRYADALALGLWPSRGIDLHGFEIKVYRGDWLRELERPDKADDIASVCDYWWIAAAPGVVDLERDPIPPPWGVLVLEGRGLVARRPAEKRADRAEIDRAMLAAILRRSTERMVPLQSIQARIDAAREEGIEVGKRAASKCDHAMELETARRLRESVDAFQATSGIAIETYNGRQLGELVKAASVLDAVRTGWQIRDIEKRLADALEGVREARAAAATRPEAT